VTGASTPARPTSCRQLIGRPAPQVSGAAGRPSLPRRSTARFHLAPHQPRPHRRGLSAEHLDQGSRPHRSASAAAQTPDLAQGGGNDAPTRSPACASNVAGEFLMPISASTEDRISVHDSPIALRRMLSQIPRVCRHGGTALPMSRNPDQAQESRRPARPFAPSPGRKRVASTSIAPSSVGLGAGEHVPLPSVSSSALAAITPSSPWLDRPPIADVSASRSVPTARPAFESLIRRCGPTPRGAARSVELHPPIALGAAGISFPARFQETLQGPFGARRFEDAISSATRPTARLPINAWVEEKTWPKIRDLIPQGALDSSPARPDATHLFKGVAGSPVSPRQTQEEDFHVTADRTVRVPFRHLTSRLPTR